MKFRNYLAVLCALASPAFADDQALVIANANYQFTAPGGSAESTFQVVERLRKAGYRVQKEQNLNKVGLERAITTFNASAKPRDHVVYVYVGHTMHEGNDTYLMPVDLQSARAETIAQSAVNLNTILDNAAKHSGASAVFLGWTPPRKKLLGSRIYPFHGSAGLGYGLGQTEVPQGVLLVNGMSDRIVNIIKTRYFEPNISTRAVGNSLVGHVWSQGYLSLHSYLNREVENRTSKPAPVPGVEQSFWEFTKQENTIPAYEAFIKRFPNGKYFAVAQKNLKVLRAEALISPAERAERALNLTRDEKRDIQRALTVLGHDTRGVDGLFGPASRRAISRWQARSQRPTNGFLDQTQVRMILNQGETKRRALLEEAKRKRLALEAKDREFWRVTGASGQEYDLRVYLNEYPDGLYAQTAQANLDKILAEKARRSGNAADRNAWKAAVTTNTLQGYNLYLRKSPKGVFAAEAKARIEKIKRRDANRKAREQARNLEVSMNIGPKMWFVVERQIAKAGIDTGKVDGVVDAQTRKALRQFQKSNGLEPTGYMNPNTLSRVFIR